MPNKMKKPNLWFNLAVTIGVYAYLTYLNLGNIGFWIGMAIGSQWGFRLQKFQSKESKEIKI